MGGRRTLYAVVRPSPRSLMPSLLRTLMMRIWPPNKKSPSAHTTRPSRRFQTIWKKCTDHCHGTPTPRQYLQVAWDQTRDLSGSPPKGHAFWRYSIYTTKSIQQIQWTWPISVPGTAEETMASTGPWLPIAASP